MNYLRGALSAASQYYRDINPSTLTGAIDVIVVRRVISAPDRAEATIEDLACSPFHVRFGKWQVLRPVDKKVKVMVNGHEIPFSMKIGDAGEAFFVFETDDDIPEDLITSPLLEATHPSEDNMRVDTNKFATREGESQKGDETQSSDWEGQLGEPEPLDLDSPSAGAAKPNPGPSALSLSRPPDDSPNPMPPASESSSEKRDEVGKDRLGPLGIINRTAGFGKAVVKAVVETEREERQLMLDRADAARNAAAHAYEGLDHLKQEASIFSGGNDEKGDEALPHVKEGEGEPPNVVYSHDAVLDASGYHSKNNDPNSTLKDDQQGENTSLSPPTISTETDDYDSYEGPSTPRSADPSIQPTPTQSPDTSKSSSPHERYGSLPRHDKSATIPTFRAVSEPPDIENTPENSPPPAYSWEWGAFPTPSPMKTTFSSGKGDLLQTQRSLSVPPELVLDTNISRPSSPPRAKTTDAMSLASSPDTADLTSFYGEGADLTADERNGRRFLVSLGGKTYEFELSICEELAAATGGGTGDEMLDARRFRAGQVSFRRFIKYPGVVHDENLVIKWNGNYITRQDGSLLMDCLVKWREAALSKPVNARALEEEEEPLSSSDEQEPDIQKDQATPKKSSSSWVRWWRSSRSEPQSQTHTRPSSTDFSAQATSDLKGGDRKKLNVLRPTLVPSNSAPLNSNGRNATSVPFPTMNASKSAGDVMTEHESLPEETRKRYAKTLRLTSDQLKQLDLKSGMNSITFSLATSGTTACTASIFLWESTDSIVVSDIDGTITKSDALGHVFTMIGRDWTHIGVAKLYTDICRNGYKIMYLTSRAIGQADSTRYYLKGINQNNYQLPDGPVIMSPDRLMASFHREVIMRKPEVFKMACLRDVQKLFGEGNTPFYAGFGNRITDALSYRSVNIPSQRIFTIDSTGEVKMELLEVAGYKSSYIHLTDLVDQMFPPIHQKTATEFSDYNFWRTPVQEFELPDLSPPSSPSLSARSDGSAPVSTFSRLRNFSLRQSTITVLPQPVTSSFKNAPGERYGTASLERLTNRHTRSSESLVGDAWADRERGRSWGRSTADNEETSRERCARKRLSLDSMPGSLGGDQANFEFDEEEEEEEGSDDESADRYGEGEEGDVDGYDEGHEDPEEAAEEGFDDDLLATGEMESVPFL